MPDTYNPASSSNAFMSLLSLVGLACLLFNAHAMGRDNSLPTTNLEDQRWWSWTTVLASSGLCVVMLAFVLMYFFD